MYVTENLHEREGKWAGESEGKQSESTSSITLSGFSHLIKLDHSMEVSCLTQFLLKPMTLHVKSFPLSNMAIFEILDRFSEKHCVVTGIE